MSRTRLLAAAAALVFGVPGASALSGALLAGCAGAPPPVAATPAPAPPAPRGPDASRFHVLMINGGANPNINYQPHLLHLRALRDVLLASGIAADHISVFSSDGADPAPDLAVREAQPESDFWLLKDTKLEHPLQTSTRLVSSEIPGVTLQPATKDGLKKWFDQEAHVLQPGDTLLLYVTDHGNRSGPDPMTNTIALWGSDQLSVTELRDLIHELPPAVRVVSLMSQCFSGAFAGLSATDASDPPPNTCGYFSSTADRPAYGCFAENVGKERVGHSFHFIRALASSRRMEDAHAQTLADDDTPDVPMRSSDAFLDDLVQKGAGARGVSVEALVSELLGPAWRDQPAWKSESALADRIAGAVGMQPPQSLGDLEKQHEEIAQLDARLGSSGRAWKAALSDATGDNLQAFLNANPTWNAKVDDNALKSLSGDDARTLSASLLGDLAAWTRKDKGDRLDTIEHRGELVEGASYRTEVRLAAVLRLRTLLMSVAGRAYLERFGTPAERDRFAALRACEDVTLPGPATPPAVAAASSSADAGAATVASPSVADDEKIDQTTRPSWLGITFSAIGEDARKTHGLPAGASLVTGVVPSSPAKAAGIAVGDVILGPPGKPFTTHNEVRAWTMLSAADQPEPLDLLRGGKPTEVTLVPRILPIEIPAAAPNNGPAVGEAAPALDVKKYRGGSVSLNDGKPHLLLFWATWCGPCKASLPEVLAYERKHHTQVIAITNEAPATLDAFFKKWKAPFPATVAIDNMTTGLSYAITMTPGFFLIDEKGIVRARSAGYSSPPGLPIDGWKWEKPATKPVTKDEKKDAKK